MIPSKSKIRRNIFTWSASLLDPIPLFPPQYFIPVNFVINPLLGGSGWEWGHFIRQTSDTVSNKHVTEH